MIDFLSVKQTCWMHTDSVGFLLWLEKRQTGEDWFNNDFLLSTDNKCNTFFIFDNNLIILQSSAFSTAFVSNSYLYLLHIYHNWNIFYWTSNSSLLLDESLHDSTKLYHIFLLCAVNLKQHLVPTKYFDWTRVLIVGYNITSSY